MKCFLYFYLYILKIKVERYPARGTKDRDEAWGDFLDNDAKEKAMFCIGGPKDRFFWKHFTNQNLETCARAMGIF